MEIFINFIHRKLQASNHYFLINQTKNLHFLNIKFVK